MLYMLETFQLHLKLAETDGAHLKRQIAKPVQFATLRGKITGKASCAVQVTRYWTTHHTGYFGETAHRLLECQGCPSCNKPDTLNLPGQPAELKAAAIITTGLGR